MELLMEAFFPEVVRFSVHDRVGSVLVHGLH